MGDGAVAPNMERSGRRAGRLVEAARRKHRRQRPSKKTNLKRTIVNVAAEESSQKRGARRFPIWECGGSPSYHDRKEAGKKIARRTRRVHRDRKGARRLWFNRSPGECKKRS